jgi:7-carboxy-7-deazaguanine synthase
MRIAEIFYSIQGEGRLMGMPSAFVRTTGCPLRCTWCDTPYTSWHSEGETQTIEQILSCLAEFPTRYVVVTGGEPVVAAGIEELCASLRQRGYHITLETAAVAFKPLACDLVSLSPKLSGSTPHQREQGRFALRHDQQRLQPTVIRQFLESYADYQLKFVLDRPEEMAEVLALLEQLPRVERERVLLMPQGVTHEELLARAGWVTELCKQHGFRYCPRLHIELYGHRRGT